MRLFLAIVIIATCVGVNDAWSVLTPGYEYEFQYEAQVLSGIQTIDEQYSGVAFKSRVVIRSVSNALYVQFNEFQVGELNVKLDTVEVGEVPFTYNSIGEMEKYFQEWTAVVTKDGKIEEILVSPEEPTYVTNIKKGFLTNFNVNLPSPGSFTERKIPISLDKPQWNPETRSKGTYRSSGRGEVIDFPVYEVQEDGIEGYCPVRYIVESNPWPGNSTARVLNATAIVTFEDCEDDDYVDWLRTTHTPDSCSDCDEDDLDFLNTIKITSYDIREDLTTGNYIIERIESRSESLFILLTAENDQLSTNHSQVIELIRETQVQGEIPPVQNKKRITTLKYKFPGLNHTQQLTEADLYKRPAPFVVDLLPCAKQHIHRMTDEAAAIIKDRKTGNSKALEKSTLLARAYSTCSYEEIASIYQKYYPGRQSEIDSIEQIRWRVFRDTLMMSGTLPAITFLTHKVQKMEITGEEANQIIMAIPLNLRAPAAVYIQEFLKMLQTEAVQSDRQWYTTSWLAYASLIDVACGPDETVKPERPYVEDYCTDEEGKKFVKEIDRQLSSVTENWRKSVLIQSLGLITNDEVINTLRPYVTGERYLPERLRALAIYAVSDSIYESVDEVLAMVQPIFANTNNTAVIRIAALTVASRAQPDEHFLAKYGAWTWTETDEQVANFMYTTLAELSNATHPCTKGDAAHATYAESIAEESDLGLFGSQTKIFSKYIEEMGLGSMLKLAWVANNKTILPRSFYVELNRTISGYSQQPIEGALHMQGVSTVIQRLFGPDSAVFTDRTLIDILTGRVKDTPQGPEDIWQKLGILPREKDDLKISLWVKVISHMNRMFNIDSKSILKVLNSGAIQKVISQILQSELKFSYQKIGYLGNVAYIFPSSLGIPIHARVAAPAMIDLKGKVSAGYEWGKSPIEIKPLNLHLEIAPSFNVRVTARIGVYNPFTHNYMGAGISAGGHVLLPFVSNTSIDLLNTKLTHTMKPAPFLLGATEVKLFHYDVLPYTTLRPYNTFEMYSIYAKPIITHEPLDEYKYDLNPTVLGFPAKFRIKSDLMWQDQASLIDYFQTHGWLSYLTFWWTTRDFNFQTYDVSVEPNPFVSTEVTVVVDSQRIKNQYTEIIRKGQVNAEGVYGIVTGWAKPVWKCFSADSSPLHEYTDEGQQQVRQLHQSGLYNPSRPSYKDYDWESIRKSGIPDETDYQSHPEYTPQRASSNGRSAVHEIPITGSDAVFGRTIHVATWVKGAVNRRMDILLEYKRDYDRFVDNATLRVNIQNPITIRSSSPLPQLQVCAKAAVQYPSLPCSINKLLDPETLKPIKASVSLQWGESCQGTRNINAFATFKKSEDQKEDERSGDNWYTEQCKKDQALGRPISEACHVAVLEATNLNRAEIDIEYHDIPKWMWNATYQVQEWWKAMNFWQMTNNAVGVSNGESKLRVVTEFDSTDPKLDVYVFKPWENLFFENIFYPSYSEYLNPVNARTSWWKMTADDITQGYYPPICKVMANSIETFDNITYPFLSQPCQHVLVKDCTESDLFTILVDQKQPGKDIPRTFHVYLLKRKITIKPIGAHSGKFEVDFDGNAVTLKENVAYMLEATHPNLNKKILAIVTVTGEHLTLKAPYHAWMLRTDGTNAKIMVSNLWRGKVCGLCDDFTGDSTDVFTGPKQCVYERAQDFVNQYGTSEQCLSASKKWAPKTCPGKDYNPELGRMFWSSKGVTDAPELGRIFWGKGSKNEDYDIQYATQKPLIGISGIISKVGDRVAGTVDKYVDRPFQEYWEGPTKPTTTTTPSYYNRYRPRLSRDEAWD